MTIIRTLTGTLSTKDIQRLFRANGLYTGVVDGFLGPQSFAGLERMLSHWGPFEEILSRQYVWAAQVLLRNKKYYTGDLDGLAGPLTESAYMQWEYKQDTGTALRLPQPTRSDKVGNLQSMSQAEAIRIFGHPDSIGADLVRVYVPYKLKLEWNLRQTTQVVAVHEKVADRVEQAFEDIYKAYGPEKISNYKLDHYSGAYNKRRIRGGTAWSKHAFAVALDFYAARNGLTTPFELAEFSRPKYSDFLAIWEEQGFLNLGRLIGRDAMHFEIAKGVVT